MNVKMAKEAVKIYNEEKPDLILMDIIMKNQMVSQQSVEYD